MSSKNIFVDKDIRILQCSKKVDIKNTTEYNMKTLEIKCILKIFQIKLQSQLGIQYMYIYIIL